MIRFSDLGELHRPLEPELESAFLSCLARSAFVGGKDVATFESAFGTWISGDSGVDAGCASCANGTDALELSLKALGIGPGNLVATVANTFFATVEAILSVGASPVFVDIDPATMLMDPSRLEDVLDDRVRAILTVHLYGQCCDMDRILAIAEKHGIPVVEDCAQAHGATWNGRKAGTFGAAGCFSFYPGKNLGALGDGGAVVSRNADLLAKVRRLANHGRSEKYLHLEPGRNSRLDSLQAALLSAKLGHLDSWNRRRAEAAADYDARLRACTGIELTAVHEAAVSVRHLYVVRVSDRDRVAENLGRRGIETGVHYPVPLHRQPAAQAFSWSRVSLPETDRSAGRVLSLPMHPHLSGEDIATVADALVREVGR